MAATCQTPKDTDDALLTSPSSASNSQRKASILEQCMAHLNADVTTTHADTLLLSCCLISGLVDSTIYNAYGTFVSMQTGNTIFLGLGGSTSHSTRKPYGWAKSLTSITFFVFGCFCFSQGCRLLGRLRRSTLVASFLVQSIFILITAAIIQSGAINGSLETIVDDIDWFQEIPIALLSFQSAGQIVSSRSLDLAEIPTVVLTSMLHDIASDQNLLDPWKSNVKRNRRAFAFIGILVGAVAGGFISQSTRQLQIPLWVAAAIKLLVTSAWMVWPQRRAFVV